MRCPYHPEKAVSVDIPATAHDGDGWYAWLSDCCGLPAWRCAEGELHPMEARFCRSHGEPRPHPERMVHEVLGHRPPRLVQRTLPLPPMGDGLSTPCLVGDVLVYLTEKRQIVAVDMCSDASVFLATDVLQASLRLDAGYIRAGLRIASGVRYLAWDARDLRDALGDYAEVSAVPSSGAGSSLLGLPHNNTRLHIGAGLVRLVVEHDPVEGELADVYRKATGVWPGPWLIRRTANPSGPEVRDIDVRPADLWQVPIPVPGGVLVLGAMRADGRLATGALLVPTVREV
ncbi:MAG: hypothetical protein KC656_12105 [Myxococcales bacterium]|nr:hypothetical protein [Myxococcales bacterium]